MAVIDTRAQVVCNLGPVISGSLSDDHVQQAGVITTTGELLLAGLVTPAIGDQVTLAYITPDQDYLVRFPRSQLRVLKSFADPLRNQTTVQVGCDLAFQKNKAGLQVTAGLLDVINGRAPGSTSSIDLGEAANLAASRLGLSHVLPNLTNSKLATSVDMGSGYVQFLNDALMSEGYVAFIKSDGSLVSTPINALDYRGPSLQFSDLIDIAQTEAGEDPAEEASGTGQSSTLEQLNDLATSAALGGDLNAGIGFADPASDLAAQVPTIELPKQPEISNGGDPEGHQLNLGSTWTNSWTESSSLMLISGPNNSTATINVTETNETAEKVAGPDNRVLERISKTTTSLAKVNQQYVEDIYKATGNIPSGPYTNVKVEKFSYSEIPPVGLTPREQAQLDQEIRDAAYSANPEELRFLVYNPKYRLNRKVEQTIISCAEAAGRLGVKDYNRTNGLPGGSNYSEIIETEYLYNSNFTKEVRRVYRAYGLTQSGQQAIGKALEKAPAPVDLGPFVQRFFTLVLDDVQVLLRSSDEVETGIETEPQSVLQNFTKDRKDVAGSVRQQQQNNPTAVPTAEFAVPFLPDDKITIGGELEKANAEGAAAAFAADQNRLRLGHRLGLQITAALGTLPSQPLAMFHLRNDDVMASYRVNGTSWAFDATSCLVSTDALFWGTAGGDVNGERWVPVAPGVTALPTLPATTDNGAQLPANALALAVVPDVSDQSAVNALLDQLPDDEDEEFRFTAQPPALVTPYLQKTVVQLQARAVVGVKVVPGGVYKALGAVVPAVRAQLTAKQSIASVLRLQLQSGEQRSLVETFSAELGLSGNLS